MSLESADFIPGLVETNPEGTDPKSQGDDHLKLLKHVLKSQFPNFTGEAVSKTEAQLNSGLIQGNFGLGADPAASGVSVQDANAITATGFYNLNSPFANGPVPNHCAIIHVTFDTSPVQLAVSVGNTAGDLYVRSMAAGSWGAWERLWSYTELVKQTGSRDATAGRVLTVGAFGLGTLLEWVVLDFNNVTNSQIIGVSAGSTNGPPGASEYGVLINLPTVDAGFASQVFYQLTGVINRCWYRQKSAGTWLSWMRFATVSAELIATNGYRVVDGLVEQWGQTAAIGDDQTITVTFPLAMAETFNVIAQPIASVPNVTFITAGVHSVTASGFNLTNMNNGGAVCPFYWQARGRIV